MLFVQFYISSEILSLHWPTRIVSVLLKLFLSFDVNTCRGAVQQQTLHDHYKHGRPLRTDNRQHCRILANWITLPLKLG
jgi:hypothetical protein